MDLAKDKILDTLILIEKLRAEGIKANKYLDIVKFEFKTKVHELGKQIDKNQLPLTKIKGDLLNELNSIDGTYLTIATHVSSNNLMKAESILQTVDKRLTSLYKKTMVQVDSYRILNRTYDKVNAFMREFDVMNDRFVTELLKYNYESKQESIDKITINAKQVKNFYSDFKKTKLETLKIHTPTEILFALSKVIEKYKQYSTYLEKNIDKVDVIINLSNEFNSKLALLNTALLNCEYKLNKLPNTFEIKYKSNLEYSLSKTNGLIHLYKNTNVKPTTKHIEELKILVREIENIERRISTDLFFNELVKTLILILNRYRIESKIIEKYLVDVELLYHNGDLPEALRMIYNISLSNNLNE
ncbi:MAG: hypothetical protein DRP42_05270 [Tenericutes bacterium]|nr:MAG: hypothetical protein DRP42_05270 [Mycoplasmatota bacterium]